MESSYSQLNKSTRVINSQLNNSTRVLVVESSYSMCILQIVTISNHRSNLHERGNNLHVLGMHTNYLTN